MRFAKKLEEQLVLEWKDARRLLECCRSLNMEGNTKILEKFDNVCKFMEASAKKESEKYLRKVNFSYLATSNKMLKLVDEVGSIVAKNFKDKKISKQMEVYGKKNQPTDSPIITTFTGICIGLILFGFIVYTILGHFSEVFYMPDYIKTIGPFFGVFACISLAIFVYGCDLYEWRKIGINNYFIFEIKSPKTAYTYENAFLSSAFLMAITVSLLFIHLAFFILNFTSHDRLNHFLEALVLAFVTLLLCPLNVFYRSTRWCFL